MKRDKIIYVSGKYSGTPSEIVENIKVARSFSMEIWELGFTALCPHLNTIHFERDCSCTYEDYMNGDLAMIDRVDAMFMLPDWRDSKGATRERARIIEINRPVFYSLNKLDRWYRT